jgi:hypothetical protein
MKGVGVMQNTDPLLIALWLRDVVASEVDGL